MSNVPTWDAAGIITNILHYITFKSIAMLFGLIANDEEIPEDGVLETSSSGITVKRESVKKLPKVKTCRSLAAFSNELKVQTGFNL